MPARSKATKTPKHPVFSLSIKPIVGKDCHYKEKTTVSFSPSLVGEKRGRGRPKGSSSNRTSDIIPVFNKDRSHLTPAFILPCQRSHYIQQRSQVENDHSARMNQYREKTELLIPKPKSKHQYCNICRLNYEDYLQHIENQKHIQKIKTSKFNSEIMELAKNFKFDNQRESDSPSIEAVAHLPHQDASTGTFQSQPCKRRKEDFDRFSPIPQQTKPLFMPYVNPMQMPMLSPLQVSNFNYMCRYMYPNMPMDQWRPHSNIPEFSSMSVDTKLLMMLQLQSLFTAQYGRAVQAEQNSAMEIKPYPSGLPTQTLL